MSRTVTAGDELPPLTSPPISRATLALFAGASGDHHPIHIDSDVAKSAGFDDVFAHGMLPMAYLGRFLTQWAPQQNLRSFRVRFREITPLYATVTCRGRVTDVVVEDNEERAVVDLAAELSDGTAVLTGVAVVALPPSADEVPDGE
ncbi:MaoC/PaaZ C-terminal domain-containing protein [Streptomyces sp. NPDC090088]|uniref:MaoC/PaaZ C-terminal domain-containing protein n=1 Tax=Streptomyces sp. NPDC090088 TaxID=3365944 RepID=UPI003824800D